MQEQLVVNQRGQLARMQLVGGANAHGSGGTLAGVGIFFQQDEHSEVYVSDIVPDSPAEACGVIHRDDVLVRIGHAFSIAPSHTLEEIRSRILGPEGTAVLMTFRRPGGQFGTAPRSEEFTYEVELVRRKPGAAVEGAPAQADDAYSEVLRLREELRTLQERRHMSPRIDSEVRLGQLETELSNKMDGIKRFEHLLLTAQQKAEGISAAKTSSERRIQELLEDNERLLSRERERSVALKELQARNTSEMMSIQSAQERLQTALVEQRRLRQEAVDDYNAKVEKLRQCKAATATSAEKAAFKQRLRAGHASLEQALVEQEEHLHSLLEVLPAMDRVHAKVMSTNSSSQLKATPDPYQRGLMGSGRDGGSNYMGLSRDGDIMSLGNSLAQSIEARSVSSAHSGGAASLRSSFSRDVISTINKDGKEVSSVLEYC